MNNLDYFYFSLENDDQLLNLNNQNALNISDLNEDELINFFKYSHLLTEKIVQYSTLINDLKNNKKIIDSILIDIINIIENVKYINYLPFLNYFRVLNYSYYSYMQEKNSLDLETKKDKISKILNFYIKERLDIYKDFYFNESFFQYVLDLNSSKRKGKDGINFLESILNKNNIFKTNNIDDFINKKQAYILPDKGQLSLFNEIIKINNIKFSFRKSRDNKSPDILLKINNDYFIIEHKLTNGKGGSQNLEINELINFINQQENNINFHYVSCLQGNFFLILKDAINKKNKENIQYCNIVENLKNNPQNFFINLNGFDILCKNYLKI